MEERVILEQPNVIISNNKSRKQNDEYSIAVIGPSMTGKSRFIGRFFNDSETAKVLYEDNTLGKTKVNTRYIFDKEVRDTKAIIVVDLDVIMRNYTNQNKSYVAQELSEYVEARYNEICASISESINQEYKIKPEGLSNSEFICRYFEKFSQDIQVDIDLNEIFEFDLWVEPIDELKEYLRQKNMNALSLIDTRGVFDNMEICNRKMPSYVDANILFFRPLTTTSELIHKVSDDLKLYLSNPTELCLRFTAGGSIYPNMISPEVEQKIVELCINKNSSTNKDIKNLLIYEQIFIDHGILPAKDKQDNRLFTELLFDNFGTLIPDILEIDQMEFISEEEKNLKSSASKRIFDAVTFHVIDKLINISIREKKSIYELKEKLQSLETTPLHNTVSKLSADVAIDKICRGNSDRRVFVNSAEYEPRAAVLASHMNIQLIDCMDAGVVPRIKEYKDVYSWLPLKDHIYHYVSVYAYKIIEKIMEDNLLGTDEDENFLLTRMLNQMVIKETPSYETYVSSLVAKRCSINAFNSAIQKLYEENKGFTNGRWCYKTIKKEIDNTIFISQDRLYSETSWFFCLIQYTTLNEIRNTLSVQVKQLSEEIENNTLAES